jgi:hypothetical protein
MRKKMDGGNGKKKDSHSVGDSGKALFILIKTFFITQR